MHRATPTILNGLHNAFRETLPGNSEILLELCEILNGVSVLNCHAIYLPNLTIDCARNDVLLIRNNLSSRRDTQIPFELTSTKWESFSVNFHFLRQSIDLPPWFSFL